MNKKVLSFIIMLNLILSIGSNVLAAASIKESDGLKETREQKKQIQQRVEKMDSEIDNVINEIDRNKQLMNKVNKDVKDTENKLNQVKNNVKEKEELFGKRVRAMYISGGDSYLDILLGSENLSDFMSRVDTVSKVMKFDINVVTKLKEEKEAIAKQKENLDQEKNKLSALKKNNEVALLRLNKNVEEEKRALNKVNEKESELVANEAARAEEARKAEENSKKAKEVAASDSNSSKGQTLSRGESNSTSYSKVMVMEATAYAGDGITASGNGTNRNPNGYSTIAVDPRVIPLGSRVYVEGYGYAIAHDTGGDIKGNRIDLFMNSEAECNSWGRRSVKVYILG
ncbi:3D domain-containing protein [Clostridium botulinum]|uniref:3D domain-containing protein n=1 Tax=Clostridium botulinum TaxID=1491 RepID=UPI000957A020|nr:3D domain-containing protein [Clostridium botulinum]APU61748.1 3D domain protein [Clostridium botulinum]